MAEPSKSDNPHQTDSSPPEKDDKSKSQGEPHRPGMGVSNPEIYPKGNVTHTATPIYPPQEPGYVPNPPDSETDTKSETDKTLQALEQKLKESPDVQKYLEDQQMAQ